MSTRTLFLLGLMGMSAGCNGVAFAPKTSAVGDAPVYPTVATEALCATAPPPPPAPVPLRRINRLHVQRAVQDVLGATGVLAVPDERLFSFRSNITTPVDETSAQAYLDFAEKVVDSANLSSCTASGCRAWLLDSVGRRLFRRPLTQEQRTRYGAVYDQGLAREGTAVLGAKWALQAMLQSPDFLYLEEPVSTEGLLDGYAVAARLAQAAWSSNPDVALLDAAATGELDTPEGIRERLRQMLRSPLAEQGLSSFVGQWLEVERLEQTEVRPDLVALGTSVLDAMQKEPGKLFHRSVIQGGSLTALLVEPTTLYSSALTSFYGAEQLSNDGTLAHLDPTKRAGLLTLPGVVASLAHAGATSPTMRGHAILSHLLCTPPAPPPAGVNVTLPEPTPGATTRQRLEQHFSSPTCASCHRSMDGLGFAFENYDALGRWRAEESGRPVDARSDFTLGADTLGANGAIELSALLASRREVADCFARHWMRYATGVPEPAETACFAYGLAGKITSGVGLEEIILDVAASDYFRKGSP